MAIDTNMNTTPAMDQHHHINLAQENKHLQEKNKLLYAQVELLTKLHHMHQKQLLHQHDAQNADSEDSAMKEDQDQDQDQPLPAESELKKHESEKQLEGELKQDDSDVTLGREDGEQGQEKEHDAQDKGVDEPNEENDGKMDEDKNEDKKEEYSEEEHSSYANSEASDYEGPEPWTGDDLGGDTEDSDPERLSDDDDSEDETMEDEAKEDLEQKPGLWSTGSAKGQGPEYNQSRQSRNYFIAKYKCDKLQNATALDKKVAENPPPSSFFGSGSLLGECKLDSQLYYGSGLDPSRTDFSAYKSLYGFHPAIVDYIEYEPTIRLLDRHADMVVSWCTCTPGQEFHNRFREFIEAFEKADYPSDYLDDDISSEVARAHLAFCEVLNRLWG